MIGIAMGVFERLDFDLHGPVKQMFAAAVMRLKAESPDKIVQRCVSNLLCKFPEIQELRHG